MADLAESEWELGGVRFGGPLSNSIAIAKVNMGEFEMRTHDTDLDNPGGVLPGVDRFGAATWSFDTFTVYTRNAKDGYAAMQRLQSVMPASSINLKDKEMIPLRFCAGGVTYQVMGRVRRWTNQPPDLRAELGKITMSFDFRVMTPGIFRSTPDYIILYTYQQSLSGVVAPVIAPVETMATSNTSLQGSAFVDGDMPVPFSVFIKGPTSNAVVTGDGWRVELTKSLAYDETCVVDMITQTVKVNGVPRGDIISRTTRLNSRLKPGNNLFLYTGTDPSNLSTATITWRSAWSSL